MTWFQFVCNSEKNEPISNRIDEKTVNSFESLLAIFRKRFIQESSNLLELWKSKNHQASAKEPYAWREVLELVKSSDLSSLCSGIQDPELRKKMTDRPLMLKIAGEVTNAMSHSYNSKHRISFAQIISKDSSSFAL